MPENKAPEDSKWVKPSPETIAEMEQASKVGGVPKAEYGLDALISREVGGVVQVAASLDELTIDKAPREPEAEAPPELHDGPNENIPAWDGGYGGISVKDPRFTNQKPRS